MEVAKAVITAAGRGTRLYPAADTVQKAMLPLVDCDGFTKPVIQIIAEDALASGIQDLCIVCSPGDEESYLRQFRFLRDNLIDAHGKAAWAQEQAGHITRFLECLHFAVQQEPLGYGHAVHCASGFVGSQPFLLMLGDHVHVPAAQDQTGSSQVIDIARRTGHSVSAVQATPEHLIARYGTVAGTHVADFPSLYRIERIVEKPSVSLAELQLHTPGLRVGHFLCLLGLHALSPDIMGILEEQMAAPPANGSEHQLTPALQELAIREECFAYEVSGSWYDTGRRYGVLRTQLALGLAGVDSPEVLNTVSDVLIEAHLRSQPDRGE